MAKKCKLLQRAKEGADKPRRGVRLYPPWVKVPKRKHQTTKCGPLPIQFRTNGRETKLFQKFSSFWGNYPLTHAASLYVLQPKHRIFIFTGEVTISRSPDTFSHNG
jgi:hypothetical protein